MKLRSWFSALPDDFRHAARALAHRPRMILATTLTFALFSELEIRS